MLVRIVSAALLVHAHAAIAANELTREKAAGLLGASFKSRDVIEKRQTCVISFSMIPSGNVERAKKELMAYMKGGSQMPALPNLMFQRGALDEVRDGFKKGLIADVRWHEVVLKTYPGNTSYAAEPVFAPQMCQKIDVNKSKFMLADRSGGSEPRGCDTCTTKTATVRFGEVTGIRSMGEQKVAEFTVVVEPTEVGKRMGLTQRTETKSAAFVLYDDGWRLVQQR